VDFEGENRTNFPKGIVFKRIYGDGQRPGKQPSALYQTILIQLEDFKHSSLLCNACVLLDP
jgi:hypothetical protein